MSDDDEAQQPPANSNVVALGDANGVNCIPMLTVRAGGEDRAYPATWIFSVNPQGILLVRKPDGELHAAFTKWDWAEYVGGTLVLREGSPT